MKLFSRLRDDRFCAFCKVSRRVYVKKHIDLTNVVEAIVFALVLSYAFWGDFDPRGILLFCLFVILGEIFVYCRWRLALVCTMCGFDPLVYKRSPETAAARVNKFFTEKTQSSEFWLTRSPLLEVHRRWRESERKRLMREAVHGGRRSSKPDISASSVPVSVLDSPSNEISDRGSDLQ